MLNTLKKLYQLSETPSGITRAGKKAGCSIGNGYYQVCLPKSAGKFKGKFVYTHRIVYMLANNKEIPDGLFIDHIDKQHALPNSPSNLRLCTASQNNSNKKLKGKSNGLPSRIHKRKNGFFGLIIKEYKYHKSPLYSTIEEAQQWVERNGPKIHGEFFRN